MKPFVKTKLLYSENIVCSSFVDYVNKEIAESNAFMTAFLCVHTT